MKRVQQGLGWLFVMLLPLAGCGGMSGYDAKSSFGCKAPDGVLCESMSGIYANVLQHNLPGQKVKHTRNTRQKNEAEKVALSRQGKGITTLSSGLPIRSTPRILRVWFAPWEDSDQDLHDQSYLYLLVDTGHWRIEHAQQQIQDTHRPVRAPAARRNTASAPSSAVRLPTKDSQGTVQIGVRQDRPNAEQAAQFFEGVRTPNNVMVGEG